MEDKEIWGRERKLNKANIAETCIRKSQFSQQKEPGESKRGWEKHFMMLQEKFSSTNTAPTEMTFGMKDTERDTELRKLQEKGPHQAARKTYSWSSHSYQEAVMNEMEMF